MTTCCDAAYAAIHRSWLQRNNWHFFHQQNAGWVEKLLEKKTSVVGTIRVNRLEIPPFVKLHLHESVFYSSSPLNSTVYQAKHIKSVLILSMLHSGAVSSCLAKGADTLRPNNKIMWPFAGNIALVNTMKSNARLWWKRVNLRHHRNSIIIMWPSSLGGAAYCVALCLSVRLSVCPSVRPSRYHYRASRGAT